MNFIVFYHNATKSYTRWTAMFRGSVPEYLAAQHETAERREYASRESMARDVEHYLAGGNLDA